jgi:hypothetical protein
VNDLRKRTISISRGKIVNDEEKGRYHMAHKGKGNLSQSESGTDAAKENIKEKKNHGDD